MLVLLIQHTEVVVVSFSFKIVYISLKILPSSQIYNHRGFSISLKVTQECCQKGNSMKLFNNKYEKYKIFKTKKSLKDLLIKGIKSWPSPM